MRAERQTRFQFGVENVQRPGDFMTIDHFNTARGREAHHRQQNMVQAKGFEQ